MSLGSSQAQAMALDACYGDGHAANWPASVLLAACHGNPTVPGTEMTSAGGYARVVLANDSTNFPAADVSTGIKTVSNVRFPLSTGAWSDTVDFWALYDDTGLIMLDYGQVVDGGGSPTTFSVTVAGRIPVITFTLGT